MANVFVRRNMPPEESVELMTRSDRPGNFVLTLSPGVYDVLVTALGFESKVQTILVRPGKTTDVEWKLTLPREMCDFPGVVCDTFPTR